MFTVGKFYDFELLDEADDEGNPAISTYPHKKVLEVNGPLVKVANAGGEVIFNTHSSAFVRATLVA